LDVRKLSPFVAVAVVGYDVHYHKAQVHVSPVDRINCPDGKACGSYGSEKANVWKCIGDGFVNCFPIGDLRYGLRLNANVPDIYGGVRVHYAGGADGYSVSFWFHCDESLGTGELQASEVGYQGANKSTVLFLRTREVCPAIQSGNVSGGAVFLLLVALFVVIYFGIGTVVQYWLTGTLDVLNSGLWRELGLDLLAVLARVFKGRGQPDGAISYEPI
jgi:hypothetical protein